MNVPDSIPKIERVNWDQLIQESLDQLRTDRGAILYLANTMKFHESKLQHAENSGNKRMPLPIELADLDFMEPE